jgi:hypothetical protein
MQLKVFELDRMLFEYSPAGADLVVGRLRRFEITELAAYAPPIQMVTRLFAITCSEKSRILLERANKRNHITYLDTMYYKNHGAGRGN